MYKKISVGEISEGTGSYGGTLERRMGTARTSANREDRGRQKGKGNRGSKSRICIPEIPNTHSSQPRRDTATYDHDPVAFTYLNRPSSVRTNAGYLQRSIPPTGPAPQIKFLGH